jgi:Zn-dependent protease/uncharacterized protein YqgV (UPF0045/DUF77 family)
LQFRLGPIPVRIHGSFFILTLLLGMGAGGGAVKEHVAVAIWAVVVLFSVLVHELGHALAGRAFGLSPQIDLHGMGGTTSWATGREIGNLRSVVISLSGPFAGFAIGVAVVMAGRLGLFVPETPIGELVVRQLIWVNIGWGIMNLMPLLPLDGGNVMRSVLNALTNGRGEKPARVVSIGFCALVLVAAFFLRSLWIGLLGALFLMQNVRGFRAADAAKANVPLARAIEGAYHALERHDGAEAIGLLRPVLVPEAAPELRQIGLRVFAYALLIEGHWGELMPLLERERAAIGDQELRRFATTARELGRPDEGARIEALVSSAA